jgi:hypothetical protein
MFDWVFDLPMLVAGPTIVLLLVLFSVIGLRLTRRHVLTRMRIDPEDGDFGSGMLQAVMTIYGLALALIASRIKYSANLPSSGLNRRQIAGPVRCHPR